MFDTFDADTRQVRGGSLGGAVRGSDLLSGRGRDSEGRPIEAAGLYVVTRDRAAEQRQAPKPTPERRVLVEVPERALSQLPPGSRVVDGGRGTQAPHSTAQGQGGRHSLAPSHGGYGRPYGGGGYGGHRGNGGDFEIELDLGDGEFELEIDRDNRW